MNKLVGVHLNTMLKFSENRKSVYFLNHFNAKYYPYLLGVAKVVQLLPKFLEVMLKLGALGSRNRGRVAGDSGWLGLAESFGSPSVFSNLSCALARSGCGMNLWEWVRTRNVLLN